MNKANVYWIPLLITGYYGSSGLGGVSSGYGYDRQRGPYGPPQTVDLPGGYYSHDGYGGSGHGHDIWADKWQVRAWIWICWKNFALKDFFCFCAFVASFQIEFSTDRQCGAVGYRRCVSLQSGAVAIGNHFSWPTTSTWNQRGERGHQRIRNKWQRRIFTWFGV